MKKKIIAIVFCIFYVFTWATTVFANSEEEMPSGIPFSETETFIDRYMAQYIGKTSPGAAVVLVKDGEIIFSKGYGYANIEKETLVNPATTVFEYGSVSKLFVYTTLMKLSEEGKIDLQADIREYLPDGFLKKLRFNESITMLNIMNHTTGFEDYLFDVVLTSQKKFPTLEQTLQDSQPMQVYRPGTASAYSNYSVALAVYIAQQILGQDFYEYIRETVFLPLDMDHTSAHPKLEDKPELMDFRANGYYPQRDEGFKPGKWSYVPMYPIGGVNGTAEDLARFAIALMPQYEHVSPLFDKRETLDEMLTQSHAMGPQLTGFAHGFIEWEGEYRAVGHGGNTAAFSAQINIVPEERFGVVVLTNAASEMDITSGLTEALIGKRDKNVIMGSNNLPSVTEVEGTYISARRMHSGFLEVLGYFSLLNVKVIEPNKIELSMAGQTSTLVQTDPYIYQRIDANGTIFKYHFGTVYFEVTNGKVQRMSGDYLPLSSGRTIPWLIVSLLIAITSALYFFIAPVAMLIGKIRRKKANMNVYIHNSRSRKTITSLVLCGTATLTNNALLVTRMIIDNYRSFSEMRIHVLLNYPLTVLAGVLIIILAVNWKHTKLSAGQKIYYWVTVIAIVALIGILINWNFFNVMA